MNPAFRQILLSLLVVFFSAPTWAHKASDAYVLLTQSDAQTPVQAQLAIALRDLDRAFDTLDANNDRALNFTEIKASLPEIERWVGQGIELRCGTSTSPLAWRYEALEQRSDGVFVRLSANTSAPCDTSKSVSLRYTLMQEIDADHRAIVSFKWQPQTTDTQGSSAIKPSEQWQDIADLAKPAGDVSSTALSTLGSFIVLGMEHIGSGADHIAFIICLVLTLALTLAREWKALLITVTAFTLGHSVTLISATLGWVGSPSWVEPVIALSIAIAAAFNLVKQRFEKFQSPLISAAIASLFGLVHGLGFSGAMTEAQLPEGSLLWALAGFNIGVELGQLLIIAAWSLIYLALHRWAGYQRWIVQGGSIALIILALYWFFERLGVLG
ncbi:HupE/UreJ family protein [Variovorax sp. PCZ-1]|uniref:HupE/UreJ family protein n=1 Tax=Variovorax sp. PCZ-1 TaxID=2835533 RepID=UPI001BCF5A1C|nr:HupE/UreJ family protein [Variovorax sp. PCZ-1]MBS7807223.1 HupE/UreJ family protein [Variovorax sp. PCZ-1]